MKAIKNIHEMSKCVKWLQNNKFENFTIEKIHISRSRSEIYVVADFDDNNVDKVLDEFYNTTCAYTVNYKQDIVFMITSEKSLMTTRMPKFEEVINVISSI